ncbi:MAG: GFA family protein [Paracoccaceae bacterium]|nr:GFA family protein [Paracoccaceae bacterium]MDH5531110.1 GFA family protein [Paracoccaceae bacterium]
MADYLQMGGCSCGRVRYRLRDTPLIVHACHCRMCQRLTGSTNAVNVLIEACKVVLESGEVTQKLAFTPSGHGQLITRCADCQVAVWSEYLIFTARRGVAVRFIRAGTLDRPDRFPPDVHIYAETMQDHFLAAPEIPQFPKFYDLAKVWSPSSLERLSCARSDAV